MPLVSTPISRKKSSLQAPAPYSDDVFSTLLYTGTGALQTYYPGLTEFDQGGAFLSRFRSGTPSVNSGMFWDTERGGSSSLQTNSSAIAAGIALGSFNPNGLTLGSISQNTLNVQYASWFFKEAKSFFKAITYNGNGTFRSINHGLECTPGMIIVKSFGTTALKWAVWHRSAAGDLFLNDSTVQSSGKEEIVGADATVFTLGGVNATQSNSPGVPYIAYVFAHDISDESIIRCGSFTTDANGAASAYLGFDMQSLWVKRVQGAAGDWQVHDATRGFDKWVGLNTSGAEATSALVTAVTNGFNITGGSANNTYVYMAIRKRNKPNTSPNNLTILGGNSIDVYAQAIANGWDQVSPLVVTVEGDVGSNSTAIPALSFNGSYPDVTLIVNSGVVVAGRGGLGTRNAIGAPGGPAIKTTGALKIINNGIIGGGGGSGGGYYSPSYGYSGNGAGLPILAIAGTGATGTQATQANSTVGGNGASGSRGAGGVGGSPGSPGSTGQGGGGGGGLGAAGGSSSPNGSGTTFTDPGGEGQAGPGTTDSDPTYNDHPAYAGGAAGPYAQGNNNITWLTPGTRYGAAVA